MRIVTITCLLGIIALCPQLSGLEITAKFPIVTTSAKGTPELKAPEVLQQHLSKIFKAPVKIIPQSQWKKGTPAIVLRPDAKLGAEEWNIESDGKVLTISGGWPRGLFYGVCEFLEKFGGVRWFTVHEVRIPFKKAITVPDKRSFRRKPAFPLQRRVISSMEHREFQRLAAYLKSEGSPYAEFPHLFGNRGMGNGHSYWRLTKAVPKNMERMLPVDRNGMKVRPVDHVGSNQVCFSNPEFRAFAKKEIGKWIARGEKYVKDKKVARTSWMSWIDLSQNDNWNYCYCDGCRKLIKKYGTVAGAQLEFINDVASAYPDYMFQTFAYQFTQEPPKNIKGRDNVMIHTAFLSYSDLLRPISASSNDQIRKQYENWRNVLKNKAVWTYHRLYHLTEAFPWPQCCYWNIAENIRYFQKYGAVKMFIESEFRQGASGFSSRAFNDLHHYLECKMMDDPSQDDKILIEEFFQFMYGPAVKEMKAYAAYLKKRIDAVPGRVHAKPLKVRNIMDAEFFKTVNKLFADAEAKAGKDKGLLIRIAMERIPVDYAASQMWKQGGSACGVTREQLIDRLEKNVKLFFERYHQEKWRKSQGKTLAQWEKDTFKELELMRKPLPIPERFAKEDVIQIPAFGTCDKRQMVADPEAAYGWAVKLGKVPARSDHSKFPMKFGIYDATDKTYPIGRVIKKEEVPQDEKFHLYLIGRHVPNGYHREILWGHHSWRLAINDLYKKVWDPIDGNREYDIYISCKLTGPAYVKNSKKENAVYVDKLLAVKKGTRTFSRSIGGKRTLPIPHELAKENPDNIIQIAASGTAAPKDTASDRDAVLQRAVKLGKVAPKYDHAKFPMSFALYDGTAKKYYLGKKIEPKDVPQDEKYHLYFLGIHTPERKHSEYLFGHRSWGLKIGPLYSSFRKYAEPGRKYKFYVSCKLTGPAYVKNSKKENAVYVDRLIAIKCEEVGKK